MEKDIKKIDLIKEYIDIEYNNLFVLSADYVMTVPKEGYEKQWNETKDRIKELKEIATLLGKKEASPVTKEMLNKMSINELSELFSDWGLEKLTCLGHAERFFKTVYLKIEKKFHELPSVNKHLEIQERVNNANKNFNLFNAKKSC